MRLGGPVGEQWAEPEQWVRAVAARGYGAAYCPVAVDADEATVRAFSAAAERADIVIAEVGAWSNPLSADPATRAAALDLNKRALDLAERINARCCVNIAGSRGPVWDGPAEANFTAETFDMIVDTVREIIDAVRPGRTFYTLEPMPWIFPDSPDEYLRMIAAVNREAFAVHLDPVNIISSPRAYYRNGDLLNECFTKLGPYIKSCHAKDTVLRDDLTVRLEEVRPGLGRLDYRAYLHGAASLPDDVPVMLEHLDREEDYDLAAEYVRSVAAAEGLAFQPLR